jgi:hypothetical protein
VNKQHTAAERLQLAEERIEWVLSHPDTSEWLKASLRMARARDPIKTMNELELLTMLLQDRSHALVDDLLLEATSASPHRASRSMD